MSMRERGSRSSAFQAWAFVALGAASIVAGLDATGALQHGEGAAWDGLLLLGYLLGLYGALTLPFILLASAATRTRLALREDLSRADLVSGGVVLAWGIAGGYAIASWAQRSFANRELSSLLAACMWMSWIGGLAVAGRAFREWASRLRSGWVYRVMLAVAMVVAALALIGVVYENRHGFAQLSIWLRVMPGALVAYAVAAAGLRRVLAPWVPHGARAFGGMLVSGVVALAVIEASGLRGIPSRVAEDAPLGAWIARAVHGLTDFDGDGFAVGIGGRDCAPFDSDIAPGVLDVPGDGVDANCVGGDASRGAKPAEPRWHALPSGTARYDVLLISVETLRADHLGFMGYDRPVTPNLDRLARRSQVLERFYASSTYTRLSLPSLMTSRAPSRIAWEKQKHSSQPRISSDNPWLAETLHAAGFATAAVTASFPAFTQADAMGFERGFDHYDAETELKYSGGNMRGFPAGEQVERATSWIADRKAGERFFLWMHLFEPHYLYQKAPGAPKLGDSLMDKYDSEIWAVDRAVGRVMDFLKKSGRFERTVIVLLADHGEAFKEHGKRFHGSHLYEPQVRIPLLLHVPHLRGRRFQAVSSLVDVAPTVLSLAGVREGFEAYGGRNLAPLLHLEPIADRPVFLEVWKTQSLRRYKAAVLQWPYKLIASGAGGKRLELYDVAENPAEDANLLATHPDVASSLRSVLFGYMDATDRSYD